eukprot:CAMPEP_0117531816 /NCGR_PEP_ID=MMETSP0784-20121206/39052_1 /TAXON_ID=39447 /ORGANISM="" /LENGTH=73 /DNA_ID=CAMNT_0005328199 /DNA_START=1083 /DNA_END=1304 /DNA_ORIENTATION=-
MGRTSVSWIIGTSDAAALVLARKFSSASLLSTVMCCATAVTSTSSLLRWKSLSKSFASCKKDAAALTNCRKGA